MNPIQTIRDGINDFMVGDMAGLDKALAALAELERQHFTPEDMADAQAKAFRDGVASVTAGQEPVGWFEPPHGAFRANPRLKMQLPPSTLNWQIPVYTAAPVAQQPNEWKEAVLDKLAEHCLDAPQDEPPSSILRRIIDVAVAMATDPAINAPAPPCTAPNFEVAQQPQAEAVPELTDSQIMASVGRNAGGPDTSISESRPLGQQWTEICALVRHIIRERYCGVAPQQADAVPPTRAEAAAEILQYQLGWTYHDGEWIEDKAATETLRRQAKAVPHLFDPKHMLAVFDKARHGSTGPAGFARGIVAVIAEWEAGSRQPRSLRSSVTGDYHYPLGILALEVWTAATQQSAARIEALEKEVFDLRNAAVLGFENHEFQRRKADAATATVYQFHYAMKDAGWHPGRTDDKLCDIIRAKGAELAKLEAEVLALRKDAERLDWLEKQGYGYGFQDIHEGNKWEVEGPFGTVRNAIDAAIEAERGEG